MFSDYCKIIATNESSASNAQCLSRVQLKNIQIIQDLVLCSNHTSYDKAISFKFCSPVSEVIFDNGNGIVEFLDNNKKAERLKFDLLIECIGFQQNQLFENLAQDDTGKFLTRDGHLLKENIYACGWARTGAKGNISDSMNEALNCATSISTDLARKGNTPEMCQQ